LRFAFFSGSTAARAVRRDQIADMNHGRIVERIVVHDKPRMAGAFEHAHKLAELDVLLHGNDIRARNHDVSNPALAKAENILEHPAFVRGEAGFTGAHGIEYVLEVGSHCARLPAEQGAQGAHEPVLAAFLCRRYRNRQVARLERRAAGRTRTGWIPVRHGGQASSRSRAR
jgi:hypothetical protein